MAQRAGNGGYGEGQTAQPSSLTRRFVLNHPAKLIQESLDGQRGAAFVMVVDVEDGENAFLGIGPRNSDCGANALRPRHDNAGPVLPRAGLDFLPVSPVEPDHCEIGRRRAMCLENLANRGHVVAVQEDEAEAVL